MKMRAFWMIGLALLLAGASVFLARDFLDEQSRTAEKSEAPKVVTVVVAKQPLYFGTKVRNEHLRVVEWPAELRPQGTFTTIKEILEQPTEEEAREGKEPQERVALRAIEVGEPVLRSKISGFGGRATLSTVIAEEMRATTIRVNDVNGVAGFVLPGDRVDVMLTRDPGSGGKENLITDILLQNLKVLAIDQDANQSKDQPKVARAVTLEVTPEQAQKLVLAQQIGFLSLTLRNVADSDAEKAKTVSLSDLRIGEANNIDTQKTVKKDESEEVKKEEPKRTVVVRKRSDPRASVRIVRGTASTSYNVLPEPAGSYSAPASTVERPSNVVPRTIWQEGGSNDNRSENGGAGDQEQTQPDKPVSLLEGNSQQQGAVQ